MALKSKSKSSLADRFTLASEDVTYRTIASLQSEVGLGKTYFGCTAPGPILIQDTDQGTEGVVEDFRKKGKEIYLEKYVLHKVENKSEMKAEAIELRDQIEEDFRYAVANGARTVVWDTESRVWEIYRYAEFGDANADDIKDYALLNGRFETLINEAKETNINFFLLRSFKTAWGMVGPVNAKTGKKSFGKGGREVWGYEHLSSCMFMELAFNYDKESREYLIEVGKCRHNIDLQYSTIPRCSFPELGTMLIPDSTEEDWL